MSAVRNETDVAPGVVVTRALPGQEQLLTPAALAFLADLHRRFDARRQERLAARLVRQAEFDAGVLPDFRNDTAELRSTDWRVAELPKALLDRRVEITGPTDPKMVINALNSGANCYMPTSRIRPRRPGRTCSPASAPSARPWPARSTGWRPTARSTTCSSPSPSRPC